MIKKIKIKNFKSIKGVTLELARLNLLCGGNASGKTSVTHAILSILQKRRDDQTDLDGELIKIGSFRDVCTHGARDACVEVQLKEQSNLKKSASMKYKRGVSGNIESSDVIKFTPKKNTFEYERDFFYISSNRIGARDMYEKGNSKFGVNAESFADYLLKNKEKQMREDYVEKLFAPIKNEYFERFKNASRHNIGGKSEDEVNELFCNSAYFMEYEEARDEKFGRTLNIGSFYSYVEYWFDKIIGEKINLEAVKNSNSYVITYGREPIRAINTGNGLSYLLPIIVVCLGSLLECGEDKRPLIFIENPELHLHYEAQVRLVEFFKLMSNFSQLIIETHSEHIIKETMENRERDEIEDNEKKVFVFNKNDGNITVKSEFVGSDFKIVPISYLEVQYKAFNLLSSELHILLLEEITRVIKNGLPPNVQEPNVKKIDDWLDGKIRVREGANYGRSELCKNYRHNATVYKTLMIYIRNCMHHPDNIRTYNDAEIKRSVDFMLSIL